MTVDEMLARAQQRLHRLEPHEAAEVVRRGGVLIDVRTTEQRDRDGTVPAAVPVALSVLEWRADPRSSAHDRRLGLADAR
ncbi:MAG: hypothetical protein KY460_08860 [Actinobacteria bacterium]|nr:hypothetical protein [Actinomycetota bacterium]